MISNNTKVLFIGGMFPEEEYSDILANTKYSMQNAANNLQWELIRGIEQNINREVNVISAYFIGTYPNLYRKKDIKEAFYEHMSNQEIADHYVKFRNSRISSKISKYIELKKAVDKFLKQYDGENVCVIGYSWSIVITRILCYIKKNYPSTKVIAFVADLPQYMNQSKNPIYRLLKNVEIQLLNRDARMMDGFIFVTESMKNFFPSSKPYRIIEGIAPKNPFTPRIIAKNIVYTGGISKEYGIEELVEAFRKLPNQDIKLQIYGDGEGVNFLKKVSSIDKRIEYRGVISRKSILEIQSQAYALVNPRPESGIFTKYSFPSKTLEYMASGSPFIGYRLSGIPDEYFDYMIVADSGVEGLFQKLSELLSLSSDQIKEKGLKAQKFVNDNKTAKEQTKKVLDLFSEIDI